MKKKILLVTGSNGLIGSQIVKNLCKNYDLIYGIDNNERENFWFRWKKKRLNKKY